MTKTEIFSYIKNGLKLGKNGELIKWATPLVELENCCEVFHKTNNLPTHIYFGEREILPGLTLGLYTPFDTYRDNNFKTNLFHVGQNLNDKSLKQILEKLLQLLGSPDEESNDYGIFRKWVHNDIEICIIPRSHHGSDWNAITIEIKNCL